MLFWDAVLAALIARLLIFFYLAVAPGATLRQDASSYQQVINKLSTSYQQVINGFEAVVLWNF